MTLSKRGGWPYANPPNTQFTLNRQSPQARGLIAWYPTLAGRGARLRDMSGNGYHADLTTEGTPPTVTHTARCGRMLETVRANENVWSLPSEILSGRTAISLSVWIQMTGGESSNEYAIVGAWEDDKQFLLRYDHDVENAGWIEWWIERDGDDQDGGEFDDTPLTLGVPHLVSCTWDGIQMRVYVDGQESSIVDGAVGGALGNNDNDPILIGRYSHSELSDYLSAYIGDMRFYDRGLSAQEIRAMYSPATRWELYAPAAHTRIFKAGAVAGAMPMAVHQYRARRV